MVSALLVVTLLAAPASCRPQLAPLRTGTYSGSSELPSWRIAEAGQWGGSRWLGWRWNGDALEPLSLAVKPRQTTSPGDEGEVTVVPSRPIDFAVRCVPHVTQGPIVNARITRGGHDLTKGPLTIHVATRTYEIRIDAKQASLADARVVITDGHSSQVLYDADGFVDEPHFEIVWAGDLDRDGKLDLVIDVDRKYSRHQYRLLLSSAAVGGKLLADAAVFETGN